VCGVVCLVGAGVVTSNDVSVDIDVVIIGGGVVVVVDNNNPTTHQHQQHQHK